MFVEQQQQGGANKRFALGLLSGVRPGTENKPKKVYHAVFLHEMLEELRQSSERQQDSEFKVFLTRPRHSGARPPL